MKRLFRAVTFLGATLVLLRHTPDTVLAYGYNCVTADLSSIVGYCDNCCTTIQAYYNESFTLNGVRIRLHRQYAA